MFSFGSKFCRMLLCKSEASAGQAEPSASEVGPGTLAHSHFLAELLQIPLIHSTIVEFLFVFAKRQ